MALNKQYIIDLVGNKDHQVNKLFVQSFYRLKMKVFIKTLTQSHSITCPILTAVKLYS